MIRRQPRSTSTDPTCPYTACFRSRRTALERVADDGAGYDALARGAGGLLGLDGEALGAEGLRGDGLEAGAGRGAGRPVVALPCEAAPTEVAVLRVPGAGFSTGAPFFAGAALFPGAGRVTPAALFTGAPLWRAAFPSGAHFF